MRERVTVADAAAQLGCSTRTVRRMVYSGRLDGAKYGQGNTSPIYVDQESINTLKVASRVTGQGAA